MTDWDEKWILSRGSDIIGTFDSREEGVKYIKEMFSYSIKDLEGQDEKGSGFDYNIDFPRLQLYMIKVRESYLGL